MKLAEADSSDLCHRAEPVVGVTECNRLSVAPGGTGVRCYWADRVVWKGIVWMAEPVVSMVEEYRHNLKRNAYTGKKCINISIQFFS